MPNYAYLRVSSDSQDTANQKHGIYEYANTVGLANLVFVEDSVSGVKKWHQRRLGPLLEGMGEGDTIVFAEISRMARSTLQVLEILELCMDKGVNVHIAKQNMQLDGSMQARIIATVLGLAGEIEREFIRLRTKEALAARKKNGVILGRPKGPAKSLKLDPKREQIEKYIGMGLSLRETARLIEAAPSTLSEYIKRQGISA
ncbi:recombinase family protein [Grimontia hollisae]|uniref:Site specific recombinase n=1 Tax=Grimontia hollisae CIP 101886 TaxID=675812 RepID=D0I2R0_GRIHO|nr:recombinase family protein [Grimontia hollisae]EEY74216.1 site specific recombinase [Grimontia hollisae CIP 101886]STO79483.1 DNA-invertase hin [Grimontia hollisae]STR61853.1 DNA-invertase hin [Grimontia hollisae]